MSALSALAEAFASPQQPPAQAQDSMDDRRSRFAVQGAQGWQDFASSGSAQSNSSPERSQQGPARPQQRANGRATKNNGHNDICFLITQLPLEWKAKDCFEFFQQWGNITNIHIMLDRQTRKSRGAAKITFMPAPKQEFWRLPVYVKSSGGKTQQLIFRKWQDDHAIKQNYEKCQVVAKRVSAGVMQSGSSMLELFESLEYPDQGARHPAHIFAPITIDANPSYHEFSINFPVHFRDVNPRSGLNRTDLLRVTFTLRQRLQILYYVPEYRPHTVVLAFNSEVVPKCSRKTQEITEFANDHSWSERETLCRQTDISLDPTSDAAKKRPFGLRNDSSALNLGRWTAYSVTIDLQDGREQSALDRFLNTLRAYNADVQKLTDYKRVGGIGSPTVFSLIDSSAGAAPTAPNGLSDLLSAEIPITFDVRYQLEVCLSGGWLSEYDLTSDWMAQLRKLPSLQACALLEHVACDRPEAKSRRITDPFSIFSMHAPKQSVLAQKVPQGKVLIRSATVTPTTIIFNTPSLEISNRVIRQYAKHADRFLRVRFLDERTMGRLYGRSGSNIDDEVFTRIKRVLTNGIVIGDRLYDMLAWGNSQFRENGAYFFSNTNDTTADAIRTWMGDFSDIKVVAKYAARIGQCFSTTRAVTVSKPLLKEIPDLERNGFTFTDGVGMISPVLASMAGNGFKGLSGGDEVPSAYQFRLGGFKGVLAVWPAARGFEILVRPSQKKFTAFKDELEIIRHSQATEFCLNRQLIMVLSALGVRDNLFLERADQQLSRIHRAMNEPQVARQVLRSSIDCNHMTPVIAEIVSAGFQTAKDPFLMSLLLLWRSWSIKFLKEKAKINVTHGAVVIGVTDEAKCLKGHFNKDQVKLQSQVIKERMEAVPEVFLQLSNFEGTGQSKIIEGLMLLARNPSLYDSDIRVVKGVDHQKLRHLKDVVVIPQTGDRDLASMCSGGDLDGDDYLVCWDQELIPPRWNPPAPSFTAPKPVTRNHVTIDDLTTFYVKYMKNAELGQIAHTHLATADRSSRGVRDPKCIRLGELHSNAVDYPKTGVPATIPLDLKVKEWPHYMEKRKSYHSTSALGKLYDRVRYEKFEPPYGNPFDDRILNSVPTTPEHETAAIELKQQYDAALRRLMLQHGIKTEFEVWSTFVLEYNRNIGDYKFAEELGADVSAIKEQFAEMCAEKAGGRDTDLLTPFVVAMYKVTRDQVRDALYECENLRLDQDGSVMEMRDKTPASMPFMSFPWLFWHVLCKIARDVQAARDDEVGGVPVWKPDVERAQPEDPRFLARKAHAAKGMASFEEALKVQSGNVQPDAVRTDRSFLDPLTNGSGDHAEKKAFGAITPPPDASNVGSLNSKTASQIRSDVEADKVEHTNHNTTAFTSPTVDDQHDKASIGLIKSLKGIMLSEPKGDSSGSSSSRSWHDAGEEYVTTKDVEIEVATADGVDADDEDEEEEEEFTMAMDNSAALDKLSSMFS